MKLSNCRVCGKTIRREHSSGRDPHYCGADCKRIGRRAKRRQEYATKTLLDSTDQVYLEYRAVFTASSGSIIATSVILDVTSDADALAEAMNRLKVLRNAMSNCVDNLCDIGVHAEFVRVQDIQ